MIDFNNKTEMEEFLKTNFNIRYCNGLVSDDFKKWKIVDCGYMGNKDFFDKEETDKYSFIIEHKDTKEKIIIPYHKCYFKGYREELKYSFMSAAYKIKQIHRKFKENENINFSDDFSKMVIWILYYRKCFTANQYNNENPAKDRDFLLSVLNSLTLTEKQQRKLNVLLFYEIRPFILSHYKY